MKPKYQMTMHLDVQYINNNDKTHGVHSMRQPINHKLEKLNYFLKHFFNNVKIIQTFHRILHLKLRRILKQYL